MCDHRDREAPLSSWVLKATVQGAISALPQRHRVNRLLQRRVTGSARVTVTMFETKLAQCRRHLDNYRALHGAAAVPPVALELGTGRCPIVAIGLALTGVRSVTTVDVHRLLDRADTEKAIEFYAQRLRAGVLDSLLAPIDPERARRLVHAARSPVSRDPVASLRQLGVQALRATLPALQLPEHSVDLIASNNTLEHIKPRQLGDLMRELRRIAAPSAVMSHFIDISDHYAHFDPAITEFNYMRYSDRVWRLANNRLHYQSRLRAIDYQYLTRDAGFELVSLDPERGSPQELSKITLAPRFRSYSDEDLLTLRTWIAATPVRVP